MKKTILALSAFAWLASGPAIAESISYKVTLRMKVPRVFRNESSQGYRKAQDQTVTGYIRVDKGSPENGEPRVWADGFRNNTHKVGGKCVTYECSVTDVMWHYTGNNRTGVFRSPNVKIGLDMDPSYNIGDDEPDNTLLITLAGFGQSDNVIRGSVAGQIGCGCHEYGHVSPTRNIVGESVDIVPLGGTFTMRRVKESK